MNEPGSEKTARWVLVLVALLAVAAGLGAVGAVVTFFAASKAKEQASAMRIQVDRARASAMEEMARAEEEQKRTEEAVALAEAKGKARQPGAEKPESLQEFLDRALAAADATNEPQRQTTVREALDRASERLDNGEVADLAAAATLHSTIAHAYASLQAFDQAERHYRAAIDLRTQAKGAADPGVIRDTQSLAEVLKQQGK